MDNGCETHSPTKFNSFCSPEHVKTKSLLNGVVSGICGYGNCIGIPTVAGERIYETYNENILKRYGLACKQR